MQYNKQLFFSLAFCLLFPVFLFGQDQEVKWKTTIEGNFKWWDILDTGILMVQSSDALYGIDPEKQEIVWTINDLPSDNQEDFLPVENTPFIRISKGKFGNKLLNADNTREVIIDAYRGIVLFDSKTSDIKQVEKVNFLPSINRLFVQGKIEKSLGGRFINLDDGSKAWEVDLSDGKSLLTTLVDKYVFEDESYGTPVSLAPVSDKNGNVILALPRYKALVKLDGKTGETIWRKELGEVRQFYLSPEKDKILIYSYDLEPDFRASLPAVLNDEASTTAEEPEKKSKIIGLNPFKKNKKQNTGDEDALDEENAAKAKKEKKGVFGLAKSVKEVVSGDTDNPFIRSLFTLDVETGEALWHYQPDFYRIFVPYGKRFLLASKGHLRFLDFNTGNIEASYRVKPGETVVFYRFQKDGVYVATTAPNQKNKITYLYKFTNDGELVWTTPSLPGNHWDFGFAGQGKFYILTLTHLSIFDSGTGKEIAQKRLEFPYTIKQETRNGETVNVKYVADRILLSDPLSESLFIYYKGGQYVYRMDAKDGKVNRIISDIGFKGGKEEEGAHSLEILPDGNYLISSNQNFLCFDKDGKVIYRKYYRKPGRFARSLGNFGKALGAVTAYYAGSYALLVGYAYLYKDFLSNGPITRVGRALDSKNAQLAKSGIVQAKDLFEISRNINFSASASFDNTADVPLNPKIQEAYDRIESRVVSLFSSSKYKYVFSRNDDKTEGLFQLDVYQDKELTFIPFDDKTPEYEIDYIRGELYFLSEKNEISVFELQE